MTTFARLRDTFLPDREPERVAFCTYGLDAGFFEAAVLPPLFPHSLTLDSQAGSKQSYQHAADAALATKAIAVFYDHLSGEGPEILYDNWVVDVAPRCFHAKLAVLDYGDVFRVVVSSANLSRAAWSSLLELFIVEDLTPGEPHPWTDSLRRFLLKLSEHVAPSARNVAAELADRLTAVPNGEGASELVSSWDGPIIDRWLDGVEQSQHIDLVTPFFEGDDGQGLFDALERRLGAVRGSIWTTVEQTDGGLVVRGPSEKLGALFASGRWTLAAVDAVWDGDDQDAIPRALHGKLLAVRDGRRVRVLIGSPNATRAALLSQAPQGNVELGVILEVSTRAFAELLPQATQIDAGKVSIVDAGDPSGEDAEGQRGAEHWVRWATYLAAQSRLTLVLDPRAPPLTIRYGERELGTVHAAPEWTSDLSMGAERWVLVDDGASGAKVPFVVLDPERLEPRWTTREATFEDFVEVLAGFHESRTSEEEAARGEAGFGPDEGGTAMSIHGPIPWRRYLAGIRGLGRELEREAPSERGLAFVLCNPSRLAGLLERLDQARELERFTAADLTYALYELAREVRRASRTAGIPEPCRRLFDAALADLEKRRGVSAQGASQRLKRQLEVLETEDAAA